MRLKCYVFIDLFFCFRLIAKTDKDIVLGSGALGNRNEKPFDTGVKAGKELMTVIEDESSVDEHTQDQIIILMVMAKGRSRIKVGKITMHTKTAIFVAEKLANVRTFFLFIKLF